MKYVGIDQSLSNTGVSVMKEGEEPSFFSIKPPNGMVGVYRTSYISNKVLEIVSSASDTEKTIVCREGYSYGSNSSSIFGLAELGGCIDQKIYESRNPNGSGNFYYYWIPPTSWKLLIFGMGNVKKDTQYLLKAYETTGIKFDNDNIADSFMIVLAMKKMFNMNFSALTLKEKFGMISVKVRKKNKITDKTIKLVTEQQFKEMVTSSMEEFLIFNMENKK